MKHGLRQENSRGKAAVRGGQNSVSRGKGSVRGSQGPVRSSETADFGRRS